MFFGNDGHNPEDGSYVTTKWISVIGIPLIPLESYRIWPVNYQTKVSWFPIIGMEHRSEYKTEMVRFQWRQVLKTCLFSIPGWALLVLLLYSVFKD